MSAVTSVILYHEDDDAIDYKRAFRGVDVDDLRCAWNAIAATLSVLGNDPEAQPQIASLQKVQNALYLVIITRKLSLK